MRTSETGGDLVGRQATFHFGGTTENSGLDPVPVRSRGPSTWMRGRFRPYVPRPAKRLAPKKRARRSTLDCSSATRLPDLYWPVPITSAGVRASRPANMAGG